MLTVSLCPSTIESNLNRSLDSVIAILKEQYAYSQGTYDGPLDESTLVELEALAMTDVAYWMKTIPKIQLEAKTISCSIGLKIFLN